MRRACKATFHTSCHQSLPKSRGYEVIVGCCCGCPNIDVGDGVSCPKGRSLERLVKDSRQEALTNSWKQNDGSRNPFNVKGRGYRRRGGHELKEK